MTLVLRDPIDPWFAVTSESRELIAATTFESALVVNNAVSPRSVAIVFVLVTKVLNVSDKLTFVTAIVFLY